MIVLAKTWDANEVDEELDLCKREVTLDRAMVLIIYFSVFWFLITRLTLLLYCWRRRRNASCLNSFEFWMILDENYDGTWMKRRRDATTDFSLVNKERSFLQIALVVSSWCGLDSRIQPRLISFWLNEGAATTKEVKDLMFLLGRHKAKWVHWWVRQCFLEL